MRLQARVHRHQLFCKYTEDTHFNIQMFFRTVVVVVVMTSETFSLKTMSVSVSFVTTVTVSLCLQEGYDECFNQLCLPHCECVTVFIGL